MIIIFYLQKRQTSKKT